MIYPVKIFDGEGRLKKIILQEEALERYWQTMPPITDGLSEVNVEVMQANGSSYYLTRTIICANSECGKQAVVVARKAKYCSIKCQEQVKRRKASKKPKEKQYKKCVIEDCGNVFEAQRGNQKYCGPACLKIANIAKGRRASARAKANITQRKLELAKREQKILQRQHSPTLEGGEAGKTHPL